MKPAFAFCSFLAFFLVVVTIGGVIVLIVVLQQVELPTEEDRPEAQEEVLEESEPEPILDLSYALDQFRTAVDPYTRVTVLEAPDGVALYQVDREDGEVYYVAWGTGEALPLPEGVTEMTTLSTKVEDVFVWQVVDVLEPLNLQDDLFLLH